MHVNLACRLSEPYINIIIDQLIQIRTAAYTLHLITNQSTVRNKCDDELMLIQCTKLNKINK